MARAESKPRRGIQTRGEQTRERILDAVLELAARGGSRAVTYRAVAAEAGVALGVMSYHFASRRELLAQAFRRHLARLRSEAVKLPVGEVERLSLDEKVALVDGFLETMVGDARVSFLAELELTLELARDPELRASIDADVSQTFRMAVDLLERTGSREAEAEAMLVSSAMMGFILERLARPDDRAVRRRVRMAIRRMVELLFA
jgi:AcrR family transcriptional regulator